MQGVCGLVNLQMLNITVTKLLGSLIPCYSQVSLQCEGEAGQEDGEMVVGRTGHEGLPDLSSDFCRGCHCAAVLACSFTVMLDCLET